MSWPRKYCTPTGVAGIVRRGDTYGPDAGEHWVQVNDLAARARAGKLKQDEISHGNS